MLLWWNPCLWGPKFLLPPGFRALKPLFNRPCLNPASYPNITWMYYDMESRQCRKVSEVSCTVFEIHSPRAECKHDRQTSWITFWPELFLREKKWEDDMLPMIPMSRKKHFHKCCLRKASMKKGSDYWYYCTPRKTVKQWKIMADQCRSDIKICLKQVIAFAPWHISVRRPGQH